MTLISATLTVNITGDGTDADSSVVFAVLLSGRIIAEFKLAEKTGHYDTITKELAIRDNTITRAQLKSTDLYLEIQARGRDTFRGNPSVSFGFSDGSRISCVYRPFEIGTFGMSHTTNQPVIAGGENKNVIFSFFQKLFGRTTG